MMIMGLLVTKMKKRERTMKVKEIRDMGPANIVTSGLRERAEARAGQKAVKQAKPGHRGLTNLLMHMRLQHERYAAFCLVEPLMNMIPNGREQYSM